MEPKRKARSSRCPRLHEVHQRRSIGSGHALEEASRGPHQLLNRQLIASPKLSKKGKQIAFVSRMLTTSEEQETVAYRLGSHHLQIKCGFMVEQWFEQYSTLTLKKINMSIYFENLIIELYVLYILNKYVKFRVNWILFTIRYINLIFVHNFRLQKLKI